MATTNWTPEENRKKVGADITNGRGHFFGAVCDTSGYIYTHFYSDFGMSAMLLGKMLYEMTQTYSLKDLEELKGRDAAVAFELGLDTLLAAAKAAAMSIYGTTNNVAARVALDKRDIAAINEDARRELIKETAKQFAAMLREEMRRKEAETTEDADVAEGEPQNDQAPEEVS